MPNSLKLWHGETRAMEIIGVHRDYDDRREKFFGKQDQVISNWHNRVLD